LFELFEIIRDNPDKLDDESIIKCRGLHQNLKDFDFFIFIGNSQYHSLPYRYNV
jgi:hypothetical protein